MGDEKHRGLSILAHSLMTLKTRQGHGQIIYYLFYIIILYMSFSLLEGTQCFVQYSC